MLLLSILKVSIAALMLAIGISPQPMISLFSGGDPSCC